MTPQFKIIAICLLFASIMAFFIYQQKQSYDAGYSTAVSEMQDKFYQDLEEKMLHKKEQLDNAILESDRWKKEAIRLQGIEPVVITETEVQTIVKENNDCKRIVGIDKLLNKLSSENFAH